MVSATLNNTNQNRTIWKRDYAEWPAIHVSLSQKGIGGKVPEVNNQLPIVHVVYFRILQSWMIYWLSGTSLFGRSCGTDQGLIIWLRPGGKSWHYILEGCTHLTIKLEAVQVVTVVC